MNSSQEVIASFEGRLGLEIKISRIRIYLFFWLLGPLGIRTGRRL